MKSDYKMMTKFKNQHNEEFNVYTKDELAQIGKALQKWAEV